MRVFKFRAWDPVIKLMSYSDGKFRQICYGGAGDDIAIGMTLHYSIKNWDRWRDGKTQRSIKEITFMQFIGLLDKNGKEIYEGDIVKVGENFIAKVVFGPDIEDDNGSNYIGFHLKDVDGVNTLFEWYHGNFEVIGNIYETPDLIKE